MKKYKPILFIVALSMLLLVSWGNAGHRVIAHIAESYLQPYAKDSIKYYLGSENLEDVSVWADSVAFTDAQYKNTLAWHYIELPPGLKTGYPSEFSEAVLSKYNYNKTKDDIFGDIYKAITQQEQVLKDKKSTKAQKTIALKFLINLIGDANQPMYICRLWNWDGNSMQEEIDNKNRKLQADNEDLLIKSQGENYAEIAAKIDQAAQHKGGRLIINDPLWWLRESYEVGENLYTSAEKNNHPAADYYKEEDITIINGRLEQAGIHLADFLNDLFKPTYDGKPINYHISTLVNPPEYIASDYYWLEIPAAKAVQFIGSDVSLDAKVYGIKSINLTLELYLGAQYPNQFLTVVVLLGRKPAIDVKNILDKTVTVKGRMVYNNCRAEIHLENANNITIKQ